MPSHFQHHMTHISFDFCVTDKFIRALVLGKTCDLSLIANSEEERQRFKVSEDFLLAQDQVNIHTNQSMHA